MKLFIDDIRKAPDDSWNVVRTVTGAIRALATMEVDIISLDHDISHQVSVDGNSRPFACLENFSAVCYFTILRTFLSAMDEQTRLQTG